MNIFNKIFFLLIFCIPTSIIILIAKKYIAGQTLSEAFPVIVKLNSKGVMATVDILGENVNNQIEAETVVQSYKELLIEINKKKLNATISLKPSHLGLKINKNLCYKNISSILNTAAKYNNFVQIDMENHTCRNDTLEIYKQLSHKHDNVGVALQSRLRRTLSDIQELVKTSRNIRLCKGVYIEPLEHAFQDKKRVDQNFLRCLEELLNNKCYTCIATHDEQLIWQAFSIIDKLKLTKSEYEFQVLLGVNPWLWDIIKEKGHKLRVYVPYGDQWYIYSMRRFKENPNLMNYIIKQLF